MRSITTKNASEPKVDPGLECALAGGRDQAAVLTGFRVC